MEKPKVNNITGAVLTIFGIFFAWCMAMGHPKHTNPVAYYNEALPGMTITLPKPTIIEIKKKRTYDRFGRHRGNGCPWYNKF